MKRSVATCCQGDSGRGVGMRGSLFGLHSGTLGAFLDEIDQLLGEAWPPYGYAGSQTAPTMP